MTGEFGEKTIRLKIAQSAYAKLRRGSNANDWLITSKILLDAGKEDMIGQAVRDGRILICLT